MNDSFKEVTLDQATVGMTLAFDLVDQHGTVLLQRGSVLTDSLLAALARRGVARLRVIGVPDEDATPDAQRELAEARLAHLFRHGGGGANAVLLAALRAYRMEAP